MIRCPCGHTLLEHAHPSKEAERTGRIDDWSCKACPCTDFRGAPAR